MELARKTGARILQASTSEVYGDPHEHPQRESYFGNVNPVGVRSCYDEGKRAAETLFFDYSRVHNVDIKVVRIFNTYGEHMSPTDGRVVSNFINQALSGQSITIYGQGEQTRSFCFVSDLIDALILMMQSEAGFNGPVNLGNPHEVTIRELAQQILSLTDSSSEIIYQELPEDDPRQRLPDITVATQELNWQPKVSLREGLHRTVRYFAQQRIN